MRRRRSKQQVNGDMVDMANRITGREEIARIKAQLAAKPKPQWIEEPWLQSEGGPDDESQDW